MIRKNSLAAAFKVGDKVWMSLHGERISEPKVKAVIEFLKSLGLSESEAREVVKAVGTA
jgi:ribosomal protein L4